MRFVERLEAIAGPLSELATWMAERSKLGGLGAADMQSVGRRLVSLAGDLTTLGVDMACAGDESDAATDEAGPAT